jgi:uncharacterized protein YacL (UPF0231 family)
MVKMNDSDFHSLVRNEIEQAVNFHDSEYAADRIEALDYYLGNPLGNEIDGRSKLVQTEVSDVIESIKPSLLKIFTATDDFVKFEPRGPEDVEAAKQATEYVNYILNADNEGFTILANWFTDALLFKMGVVKHVFDESKAVAEDVYEGLTGDELTLLLSDDEVDVVEQEEVEYGEEVISQDGSITPPPIVYNVRVRKTHRDGRIRIENVPPEEFLFNQKAKSLDDCRFVAHRTTMTVSDLVSLGYDRNVVESHVGASELDMLNEKQQRFETLESSAENTTSDISQRDVLVTEAYIKADYDDDGISEIRRVVALGSSYEVVDNESYHMMPFSVISPILMPHRMVGRSIAEMLIDLQQSKTAIVRQLHDNIYFQNNARVGAVEGQVNLDDLMSNRPGGIVRMRAPGMVQPLVPPPVADSAFPLLAYMDQVREMRTGISKASLGLDPDALQSATASAVSATVSAAQSKIEMIARTFAETGVKRLMKCILQLVQKHQQQPRIIRLRNKFVTMDPAAWENEFDIIVNVGLGNSDQAQRAAALAQIASKQEQILLQMGIDNPLCSLAQYRNTLVKMLESSGFKNGGDFFLDPANLPPDVQQRFQQKMAQAGQGDNAVERMKVEAEIALAREKMMAELQLKREELEMKMAIRKQEMEFEAQLRGLEAATGANISTNIPRV